MTEIFEFLKGIAPATITGLIAGLTAFFVARTNKKGSLELSIIDQLQEEVKRLHDQVESQSQKIDALVDENFKMRAHIIVLNQHIVEKRDPPPPEY